MALGKVKRIFQDKGYGFIKTGDGASDIFFHRTQLKNVRFEELREGQEVEFAVKKDIKGTKAENVLLKD